MLKLFVTGDNHIGLKYASHEKAQLLISRRVSAFDAMVDAANREGCSLFVITGDLFESTGGIAKKDVKAVADILSRFKGTVVILPGNHDYYDKDTKLWKYFGDIIPSCDNILPLTEYRPYELEVEGERVILYPALCTALHSLPGENNLAWIKAQTIPCDDIYRIGIAHGAIDGETIDSEGQYFLMTRAELENIPVDVWLLGHTHVPFPRELTEEFASCEKLLNPGTHVQTDVSCNTEGQCFIVEIGADKSLRAKKFVSGNIRFYRRNITLRAEDAQQGLQRALSDIADESVVDIVLSGAVSAEEYEQRGEIIDGALSHFVEGTYNDHALTKLISGEIIDAEFPETSFSARLLRALLDEPKEAQLAYELLKGLKEGK